MRECGRYYDRYHSPAAGWTLGQDSVECAAQVNGLYAHKFKSQSPLGVVARPLKHALSRLPCVPGLLALVPVRETPEDWVGPARKASVSAALPLTAFTTTPAFFVYDTVRLAPRRRRERRWTVTDELQSFLLAPIRVEFLFNHYLTCPSHLLGD